VGKLSVMCGKHLFVCLEQTIASRRNIPYIFSVLGKLARHLNEAESNGMSSELQDLSQSTVYSSPLLANLRIHKET
jgi:hypothetical protein